MRLLGSRHTTAAQSTPPAATIGTHRARSASCSAPYPRCCRLPRCWSAARACSLHRVPVVSVGHPGTMHTFTPLSVRRHRGLLHHAPVTTPCLIRSQRCRRREASGRSPSGRPRGSLAAASRYAVRPRAETRRSVPCSDAGRRRRGRCSDRASRARAAWRDHAALRRGTRSEEACPDRIADSVLQSSHLWVYCALLVVYCA